MATAAVLAGVVPPTARAAHLGSAALTVALAGLPAVVTVVRGGTDVGAALLVLALGTGASLGWAADDPTGEILAATPVSAPVRAALRTVSVAAVAGLVAAVAVAVVVAGPGLPPDVVDRLPEAATAAAVALAAAFAVVRRGERSVGAGGVAVGLLLPGLVVALHMRWPSTFPSFEAGPVHTRWWLLAAAALVVTLRVARDPGRR
jgi:hypothetical protein